MKDREKACLGVASLWNESKDEGEGEGERPKTNVQEETAAQSFSLLTAYRLLSVCSHQMKEKQKT